MKTRYPNERDLMAALRVRDAQRTAKKSPVGNGRRRATLSEAPVCYHRFH